MWQKFELGNYSGLVVVTIAIYFISLIVWIAQLSRLFGRRNKTPAIVILVLGLVTVFFLIPLWALIALFLGRGTEYDPSEKKEKAFWCGVCQAKMSIDQLGAETLTEGKICRWCWIDKRKDKKT